MTLAIGRAIESFDDAVLLHCSIQSPAGALCPYPGLGLMKGVSVLRARVPLSAHREI